LKTGPSQPVDFADYAMFVYEQRRQDTVLIRVCSAVNLGAFSFVPKRV